MIGWIAFSLALIGAVLNARKRVEGFYFWLLSNGFFIWLNVTQRQWGETATFIMFTVVTCYGIYNWRKTTKDCAIEKT